MRSISYFLYGLGKIEYDTDEYTADSKSGYSSDLSPTRSPTIPKRRSILLYQKKILNNFNINLNLFILRILIGNSNFLEALPLAFPEILEVPFSQIISLNAKVIIALYVLPR